MAGVSAASGYRGSYISARTHVAKKPDVGKSSEKEIEIKSKDDKRNVEKATTEQAKADAVRTKQVNVVKKGGDGGAVLNQINKLKVNSEKRDRQLNDRIDAGKQAIEKKVAKLDARETERHEEVSDRLDNLEKKLSDGVTNVTNVTNTTVIKGGSTNSAKIDELNKQLKNLNEQLASLTEKVGSLEVAIADFGDVTDKFSGLVAKIVSPEFGAISAANLNGSFRFAQQGLQVFGLLQAAAGRGESPGLSKAGSSFSSSINSLRQGLFERGFNNPNQAKQLQSALNAVLQQTSSGLQLDTAA